MPRYLLIQTFDPVERDPAPPLHALAADMVQEGNEVTILLLDRGVLAPRSPEGRAMLAAARKSGAEVVVDERSMHARGVAAEEFPSGVRIARCGAIPDPVMGSGRVAAQRPASAPGGAVTARPAAHCEAGRNRLDVPDAQNV